LTYLATLRNVKPR